MNIAAAALPPPAAFEDLQALIAARHQDLSTRLRQIAVFVLARPDDVALETVAVVAERAGVQPSALVRFAQTLGYAGFTDMQRVFRARLVARGPSYAERLRAPGVRAGPEDALGHFVTAGHQVLDQLQATLDPAQLARAVTLLAEAEVIHLVAQRRSFPVAVYMAYGISHLGRRMQLLDGVGGMVLQQARSMSDRDAVLAVSFQPYAKETLAVARHARAAGARLVALTDVPLSPLAPLGHVVLCVEDAELRGIRALTASMCLAASLVVGLGHRLMAEPQP